MKAYRLILVALLGIMMCSCKKDEPSYYVNDLQALWLENGTQHYVRFTDEQSDRSGYFWGRQWDLSEDVHEEDLEPYGNGWFHYQLEKKGNLHEIHVMDNQGAVISKEYVVSKLTNSDLEYYESGDKKHKFYFTKQ